MDVTIVKRCADGTFAPGANCYLLRWQHPIEKKDLESFYVWLDTNIVNDSTQKISQTQMDQALKIIPYNDRGDGDSLDLTNLISEYLERDSVHIAIWAKYSSNDQGVVQHLYAHFGDDVPPAIVSFRDSASANAIWIDWIRPVDQRDFYFPDLMDGPIAGYNVTIKAETTPSTEDIRYISLYTSVAENPISSINFRRFQIFNKDGREVKLVSVSNNDPRVLRFAIIDGKGFANDNMLENEWRMVITGLRPEHTYNVTMVAYDSSGNSSAEESRNIRTTDAIPPTIANEFWSYTDPEDGLYSLDSNRLILFWPRSLDPLPNGGYREVRGYSIEQLNNGVWQPIPPRISAIKTDLNRFRLENGAMAEDPSGEFVNDTLRWILPGETITLRIRAIDSSGHYSVAWIETINVSRGELGKTNCPENFSPVCMERSEDNICNKVFCMEKLQHAEGNNFKRNILYIEAKKACEALSFNLCTEEEWNAACNSGGSDYGIIEEKDENGIFSPNEFLFQYCGVGTADPLSANNVDKRNKICASQDGIRDLPGHLQEWVISIGEDGKEVPLLKGTSHAVFQGASRTELAQCRNRFTPTRIRPRYTTETVYLYKSGSRIDTLLTKDTLRTIFDSLTPSFFKDTLLVYNLKSLSAAQLGIDYVDQKEYRRRGGDAWLNVLWQGLNYEPKEKWQVLILGTESINASNFFLDPTVGFRCCTGNFSILSP